MGEGSELMVVCIQAVAEYERPACVIVKHANPCGVAQCDTLAGAYAKAPSPTPRPRALNSRTQQALRCDPVSAFGGIIACNTEVDEETALLMKELFVEAT